jgi:hypothetical protein
MRNEKSKNFSTKQGGGSTEKRESYEKSTGAQDSPPGLFPAGHLTTAMFPLPLFPLADTAPICIRPGCSVLAANSHFSMSIDTWRQVAV